jgi:CheY-like chemotaxis protein
MGAKEWIVLLVDDDPNDVLLIRRAFSKSSFATSLHSVHDGEEAMHYLQGLEPYRDRVRYPLPCLILLDLKMPRLDGFEVLQWLRGQPKLRHLPVVVLSSSNAIVDVNRAYELGAKSCLVKTSNTSFLTRTIQTLNDYWCNVLHQSPGSE